MFCQKVLNFIKRFLTVPTAVLIFAFTYIVMLAVNSGAVGAAWVQAVGSVVAIVAAIAVAAWQKNQDNQRLKSNQACERLENIYALLALIQEQSGIMEWAVSRLCGVGGNARVITARNYIHNDVFWKLKQHERNAEALDLLGFGKEFVGQIIKYRDRAFFAAGIARAADQADVDSTDFLRDLGRLSRFPKELRLLEDELIQMTDKIESGVY